MIVVIGRVRTDAEHRAELVRIGQEVAARSRGEEGCLAYRLLVDTEDEHAFTMVEEWADATALARHFRQPHLIGFMRSLSALLTAEPDVRFHTVESTADLSNVASTLPAE